MKTILIFVGMVLCASSMKAENIEMAFFEELKRGGKQTVVFYGTSLTHSGSWTRSTKEWFDAKYPGQVTSVNSGGPGQNSDWGVKNLQEKVLAHKPDLVFLVGSRDRAIEEKNSRRLWRSQNIGNTFGSKHR